MKRPLVPVVLALMVGLTAAAWGVQIPGGWLAAGLAALLVIMLLLFWATPSGPKNPPRDSPKTADLPAKEKDHR
jgi:membrane protein implicated in regulation of membrane protease activity